MLHDVAWFPIVVVSGGAPTRATVSFWGLPSDGSRVVAEATLSKVADLKLTPGPFSAKAAIVFGTEWNTGRSHDWGVDGAALRDLTNFEGMSFGLEVVGAGFASMIGKIYFMKEPVFAAEE